MRKLLDRLTSPHARAGRTHGGFGFAPPPRISRAHATYGALGIAALVLVAAGTASFRSAVGDTPADIAAAASAQDEQAAAPAEPEAVPVAAPAAMAAADLIQPGEAAERPIRTDEAGAQPALLSFQSLHEGTTLLNPAETTAAIGDEPEANAAAPAPEAEVAQMETRQDEGNETMIREESGNAFNSPVMGEARVNRHVNLRAGPSDEARVLLVVPADAGIQAARNCNWCEVVYEGRRGFIYKTFIDRDG